MAVNQRPRTNNLRVRLNPQPREVTILNGDGAIPVDVDGVYAVTKGSAAALTVAAPGVQNIGRRIVIHTASNFAHVVTFTGTTLYDGTTGANSTWTAAAFIGSSLTIRAIGASTWVVENFNLGTIAP